MLSFREPISGFTHLFGAVCAVGGMIFLLAPRSGALDMVLILGIYSLSVIFTLLTSAIMHLYVGSAKVIHWLIKLDHAAIYLMICGTYTPVAYLYLEGMTQVALLVGVWSMGIAGIIYKIFRWQRDSIGSTLYYVVMGCLCVFAAPQILAVMPLGAVVLFSGGGIFYIVGAVVFATQRPNLNAYWGYHEIWHLFVLAGCALHYFALALYI